MEGKCEFCSNQIGSVEKIFDGRIACYYCRNRINGNQCEREDQFPLKPDMLNINLSNKQFRDYIQSTGTDKIEIMKDVFIFYMHDNRDNRDSLSRHGMYYLVTKENAYCLCWAWIVPRRYITKFQAIRILVNTGYLVFKCGSRELIDIVYTPSRSTRRRCLSNRYGRS